MKKWFEEYVTEDKDGWTEWDETKATALGSFATKAEAILAVVKNEKNLNKERGFNPTAKGV